MEPADPGGPQLARELREAGQRRPHEHGVGHRLQTGRQQVRDRGHDVVVAPRAAQGVVDRARPVDARQRGQQPAAGAASAAARSSSIRLLKKNRAFGLVAPGDVVDQVDEVVPDQRVAADEHEAARAERDALVDRVAPLAGGQLVVGRRGRVVAVPAGAAAAVRDVEVDLAQAAERLAAQRRLAGEALEHAEVGRLVDVHPERELRDLQACGRGRAQRVVEEPRAAHG